MRSRSAGLRLLSGLVFACVALALLLPSAPALAAEEEDVTWELLATWSDPPDAGLIDMSELRLWATPDREFLSFEFVMNDPFAGTGLTFDTPNLLRVLLDTDCMESTGYQVGDGLGADILLEFLLDEDGYYVEVFETPSNNTANWTSVGGLPAYLDESDPTHSVLGVDFPASLIGDPNRIRVDAYSRWVPASNEVIEDWLPDAAYGEVIIHWFPANFEDVDSTHPYAEAIGVLSGLGIINGYADSTFKPNNPVWRQHFAKMIVKTMGHYVPPSIVCPFTDVDLTPNPLDPSYPAKYIAVCAYHGITVGKTPTTFDPYANINRFQVMSMVVRAVMQAYPGLLMAPPSTFEPTWDPSLSVHGSNAAVAEYNGLLTGIDLTALSPGGNITRGETAQVLYNVLVLVAEGA